MKHPLIWAAAAALLAGCASLSNVSSDVSSFGDWPGDRKPGTYAFDRLPSQQQPQQLAETEKVEAAARPALEKAGFTPAPDGQAPDVLVQVGVRSTTTERYVWADPVWYRGGFGTWRYSPWMGPGWGWSMSARVEPARYDREVALLLRDRASGKPLFETHASNEGSGSLGATTMAAMFEAALLDFPHLGVNPRRVVVNTAQAQ